MVSPMVRARLHADPLAGLGDDRRPLRDRASLVFDIAKVGGECHPLVAGGPSPRRDFHDVQCDCGLEIHAFPTSLVTIAAAHATGAPARGSGGRGCASTRGKSGLRGTTVPGNARRGRPQGKCHREQTANLPRGAARVKGCGKSAPRTWQQERHGKPHREQDRIGTAHGPRSGSSSGLVAGGRAQARS